MTAMRAVALAMLVVLGISSPAGAESARGPVALGLAMPRQDAFLSLLRDDVADYARTVPGVSVAIADAGNDMGRQIDQVKDFVAHHVSAIVVVPVNPQGTDTINRLAAQAHIPLVYLNLRPPQGSFPGKVAVVSSNDLVAGRLQMHKLAALMGGKGTLVLLKGLPSEGSAVERTEGVKEVLKKYPDIHLVAEIEAHWKRADAERAISDLLARGTTISAIAANNDEMAIGAVQALEKAGVAPGSVLVGGVDATAEAVARIRQGTIAVTVLQDAKSQATRAVDDAIRLVDGQDVQQYDWVPFALVTPKTLGMSAAR